MLAAHLVSENCFEIGGEFSPASIRDQMVRACLVVDRLIADSRIDEHGLNLLVIGAGPTGLSAALRAAGAGVRTVVVDSADGTDDEPQFRLGACTSRDVDPTLYDWPASHWPKAYFPWAGQRMPLSWKADKASLVATRWVKRFNALTARHTEKVRIRYNTTIVLGDEDAPPPKAGDDEVEVTFKPSVPTAKQWPPEKFGAVLSCVGWGAERLDVKDPAGVHEYRSFGFWQKDEFEDPNCGRPTSPRVLISGGGDGALQDLIRIMTGGSTSRVFDLFLTAMRGHAGVLAAVTEEIRAAEEIALRAMSWNMDEEQDNSILEALEEAHERALAHLKASSAWITVERTIKAMLVVSGPSIQIVHRKAFFTQCYALNRFLALLILAVGPPGTRIAKAGVTSVKGTGHTCGLDARACHGQVHTVLFEGDGSPGAQDYEVVILRHGISGPKRIFTGSEPTRVRQIPPYFIHR